ncbi:LysR substrate-binding domain-containing protein [Arthrobacter sp. R1-13]
MQLTIGRSCPRLMLLAGELDVGLMYSLHINTEMEQTTIAPVRLQLLLNPDHPLAVQNEIALRDLSDSPAALLGLQPARDLAETQLPSAGFEPHIKWGSTNAETTRSLVARGLAYSVLMGRPLGDRTYEGLPLAYRRIKDELPDNAVVAAHPRGTTPSQKVRALLKYCQDEFTLDRSPVQ